MAKLKPEAAASIDLIAVRDELRDWVNSGEVTQIELVREAQMSPSWVQQFKAGGIEFPQIDTLQRLIDYRQKVRAETTAA